MPDIPVHVYIFSLQKTREHFVPLHKDKKGQERYHIPNLENNFKHNVYYILVLIISYTTLR